MDVFEYDAMKNINQIVMGSCDNQAKDECKLATHVVTGVTWGADTYSLFETTYKNNVDKRDIELALAAKLELPIPGFGAEGSGAFELNENEAETSTRTTVKIYGDLLINDEIPTDPDGAIAFMKSLPARTIGDHQGVPMEIELTPLVWLNSKAGKLMREIANDMFEELVQIYESFDESERTLLDLISMPYGLFRAWKTDVDALYLDFLEFRTNYSSALGQLMTEFMAGNIEFSQLAQITTDFYDSPWNPFDLARVVEQQTDTIRNLMALLSEFRQAGIITARHLADFFSWTFDSRYDRVYALVVVGNHPNQDRSGIATLRKFVQLAKARRVTDPALGHSHCVVRRNDATDVDECVESIKFVAIHFDSFCTDFCSLDFCPLRGEPLNCPTTSNAMPPCEISVDAAKLWLCKRNDHTGQCGTNPEHNITNHDKPFSDCWCACPKTQVLEYVSSLAPTRLNGNMPVVPKKPVIDSIGSLLDMEPEAESQTISINLAAPDPEDKLYIDNYKVIIVWKELSLTSASAFIKKQRVMYTRGNKETIWVSGLLAGAQYSFGVAGINDQGEGPMSDLSVPQTVGYTMATVIHISPAAETASSLEPFVGTSPNWMARTVEVRLSLPAVENIAKVTLHGDFITQEAALGTLQYLSEDPEASMRCSAYRDSEGHTNRFQSVTCAFNKHKDNKDALLEGEVQVRVWNSRNELLGMSPLTLTSPGSDACRSWGLEQLYCVPHMKCVASCDACKIFGGKGVEDTTQFGHTCATGCPENKIYCAKDSTCVDATSGASDGTCMTFCDSLSRLHTPATGDPYCAMPCELSLGGSSGGGGGFKLLAYQPIFYSLYSMYSPKQKSVAVDTTQTISCGFGYTAIGSPATADFTCPATRQEETYTKPKLAALGVTLPMCVRTVSWLDRTPGKYFLQLNQDNNWAKLRVKAQICKPNAAAHKFEPQFSLPANQFQAINQFQVLCIKETKYGYKTLKFPKLTIVGCPKKGDTTVQVKLNDPAAGPVESLTGYTSLSLLSSLSPEWGLGIGCGGLWPNFKLSLTGTPFGVSPGRMPPTSGSGAVCSDAQNCLHSYDSGAHRPFGTQGCTYAGWSAPVVGTMTLDVTDQAAFDAAFPDTSVCP
uniref:Fibronectin type-III domain-containing protein n=1 Tax=Eutreptiella gymnastica TaxID=73025 RepID=A0A6T2DI56_9EUGL